MAMSGRAVLKGVRDIAPILLGVAPFGLITGASATTAGLSDLQAIVMSAIVYAGVAQIAAFGLIDVGAPLLVILATTFMINLRLIMYGAALAPYLHLISVPMRALMVSVMTDQVFVVSVLKFDEDASISRRDYFFGAALTMWLVWLITSAVGVLFGARLPDSWSLEFAIPLVFLALLVPALRNRPTIVAASVAGAVALATLALPLNLGLLLAVLCGIAAGFVAEGSGHAA